MPLKSYRDLEVWKKGMDAVAEVYGLTRGFPAEERFGLAAQMRSAAVSIPANIAEGYGRAHRKEYLQHLYIARGSLMELETHLAIAVRLEFISREKAMPGWRLLQEVGKMLGRLILGLGDTPRKARDPKP